MFRLGVRTDIEGNRPLELRLLEDIAQFVRARLIASGRGSGRGSGRLIVLVEIGPYFGIYRNLKSSLSKGTVTPQIRSYFIGSSK